MHTVTSPALRLQTLKRLYPILLGLLSVLILSLLTYQVWMLIESTHRITQIQGIAQGKEEPIVLENHSLVLFAQAQQYGFREQLDEATLLSETLALDTQSAAQQTLAAEALYNLANARLRQGISWLEQGRLERAAQPLLLARDYYMRSLALAPEHWNARYNLDITARMVRQLPRQAIQEDDEATEVEKPEELWSEVPGIPRGLP